jgi:hypothetical protein
MLPSAELGVSIRNAEEAQLSNFSGWARSFVQNDEGQLWKTLTPGYTLRVCYAIFRGERGKEREKEILLQDLSAFLGFRAVVEDSRLAGGCANRFNL